VRPYFAKQEAPYPTKNITGNKAVWLATSDWVLWLPTSLKTGWLKPSHISEYQLLHWQRVDDWRCAQRISYNTRYFSGNLSMVLHHLTFDLISIAFRQLSVDNCTVGCVRNVRSFSLRMVEL
jgi:hypothetical protein